MRYILLKISKYTLIFKFEGFTIFLDDNKSNDVNIAMTSSMNVQELVHFAQDMAYDAPLRHACLYKAVG